MNGNSSVRNNTFTTGFGGGVSVLSGGKFYMNDTSSITGNAAGNGGGVYVADSGSLFEMSGSAKIIDNIAHSGNGGGVRVDDGGTFTMADNALVSGNYADPNGGGVHVDGGDFRISGGTIVGMSGYNGWVENESEGAGWALYVLSGTAQYGSGTSWTNILVTVNFSDTTIHVVDGQLY
ncbi:MAG: hypothetical protein LBH42_00980 [Treponema sp.]|jgi:hypothetical protein|nr:hypothetical protein [Treponema sp.]